MLKSYYFPICLFFFGWLMPMLLPAQMTITFVTTPPCNNDGTITATVTGGVPPYTYHWQNSTAFYQNNYCQVYPNAPTITGLQNTGNPTTYFLHVTDAAGSSIYNIVSLPSILNVSTTVTPANCPASDGTVALQVSGGTLPYSYSWMNGDTTASITGLGLGDTYDALVTDSNGCLFHLADLDSMCITMTMSNISNMVLAFTTTPANCLNGTATVNVVSNGTAPYNYSWSNGQTAQTATNLIANHYYYVIVTDSNGCSNYNGTPISSSFNIVGTVTNTPANCLDGTATVSNVSGGTPPYTYSWTNGQTTPTATNLVALQNYFVTITDSNSCIKSLGTSISSNSTLQATISSTPETCINGNGTATLIGIGGVQPYSYSWSNGQTSQMADSLSQGFYYGTVIDFNGCTKTQYASVGQYIPILPNPMITGSACNAPTGSVTLAPTGGTAPYTYYWNTIPPQTTAIATGLGMGTYSYTISDTAGCIKNGTVQVVDNSTMILNVSTSPNICFAGNGTAQANVIGGISPYSYNWSNGANTQNLSGLNAGLYGVTVTDSTGCVRTDNQHVNNFSPISLNMVYTNASCIYVSDATATVFAAGGTAPYTYQWANGATTQTATNILPGYQSVTVTDAAGCSRQGYALVGYNTINGCSVSISGKVYNDQNQDCMQISEPNLSNVMVYCSPGGGYDFTDANGNYSFAGLPPGNYSLFQANNGYITPLCPVGAINVSLPVGGMSSTGNVFADSFWVVKDLSISAYNYPNVPITGNPYTNTLYIHNYGSVSQNPVVTCVHDANLTFTGANPAPTSYNATTHTITWNLAVLNPYNGSTAIEVHYQVPPTTVYGTVLAFVLNVTPNANDVTPQNNQSVYNTTVVSSYDPNYIEVFPKGEGVLGLINHSDSILHYVIHFQNTGTWAAQTVAIRQPLDDNFRINSVKPEASSHEYEVNIAPDNTLIFTFNNINLPDSSSDEPQSHGFVAYTVHLNKDLAFGTELTEKADIYFDYNTPVSTNEVLNTIKSPTNPSTDNLIIYPNPAQDLVQIQSKELSYKFVSIEVINLLGVVIYRKDWFITDGKGLAIDLNTSSLSNGLYFIKVKTPEDVMSRTLLISR